MTAGSIAVPQIIPLRLPLPGKSKHDIDTNTPVEIKSGTHDVSIHYTLDGSTPDLFRKPGYGESSTLKYRGPFTLPEGKVTLKAIAVTKDGRESGVVTKVFRVEYVPPYLASSDEDNDDDDDENFLKDYAKDIFRQESQEGSVFMTSTSNKAVRKEKNSAWNEATQKLQGIKIEGNNTYKSPKGPRFLNTRLGTPASQQEPSSALQTNRSQFADSTDTSARKTLTSTQIMRIQKETDFLRCAHCLAPRPSDPFARFCQECGSAVPPVPGRRLPPPEGAQMGLCVECKTMVPLNTPTCIVCEAPIPPQLQPQASIRMKGKILCRSCGTGNPINIKHCVTCETRLPDTQGSVYSDDFVPPPPSPEVKMLTCSKCGRVNNRNARFCDWCGSKPGLPINYLTCSKCGATSHPYAHFCGSCGSYLEPPVRVDSRNSMLMSADNNVHSEVRDFKSTAAWQPIAVALPSHTVNVTEKTDQTTQTVGLFYPSSKDLEKREAELLSEKERQQKMSDRKPLLTAISPGNGYWRKQLDHICAHLRSYAQNNTEFRALIGSPRMGKMSSATVHEDGYEVSLRLNFVLAGNKDLLVGKTLKISENNFLSSITEGRDHYGSQTSIASETSSTATDTNIKVKKKQKKKKILTKEDKLPADDRLLLKEVGPNGGGRISMVQQLLEEGADPNCINNDDRPVLTAAVLNKHHEVIPVLVQKGADIDQKSGLLGNTALHEAAALGTQGLKCTEVLLGCNASIKKKNDKGLTAHDLAVKTGNEQLMSLFASKMGQGMLDKLTNARHVSLDVF